MTSNARFRTVAVAVVSFVLAVVLVNVVVDTSQGVQVFDDLVGAVAAAVASAACVGRARGGNGTRAAWIFLAVATGAWAVGQAVAAGFELLADGLPASL